MESTFLDPQDQGNPKQDQLLILLSFREAELSQWLVFWRAKKIPI